MIQTRISGKNPRNVVVFFGRGSAASPLEQPVSQTLQNKQTGEWHGLWSDNKAETESEPLHE